MKAIILAAGRGSRLLNLTDHRPKCLLKLNGKTLLDWQIGALKGAGIKTEDILVVSGYCKDQIYGDFVTIENTRWFETNMVASLMTTRDWLQKYTCIVSYSDIIFPSDAVVRLINQTTDNLTILYDSNWQKLWEKRFEDPLSDAESFIEINGVLKDIGRSNVKISEIQGQYMGLLKFTPKSAQWIFDVLDNDQQLEDRLDMTALLQLLIKKGKCIKAVPWEGTWCEIDSQQDLVVAHNLFE